MPEEYYEQPQNRTFTAPRVQDPELTKWQLSNLQDLIELEEDLRGERYNPTTQAFESDGKGEKMMNDEGIRATISWVRSNTGKNIVYSDFTIDEIMYERYDLNRVFNDFLFINIDRFSLDTAYYAYIQKKVDSIIFASLKRAKDAGEAKRTSERQQEIINPASQQKQGGLKLF